MKVTTKSVPKYEPITITLETPKEYFSLLAVLGSGTDKGEVQKLLEMGMVVVAEEYESPCDNLYELLQSYFDKVKETL